MSESLRYIKIGMVASIALFFSIVALNNVVDFNGNWLFIQHVLSMDTTFHDPNLMWRALTNPLAQRCIYISIIAWEFITAITCWAGVFILLSKIKEDANYFDEAKKTAFIGLFMGFLLYMIGFIVVGGEWFSMWQSSTWNGQMKAGLFISLIMFVMLFIKNSDAS